MENRHEERLECSIKYVSPFIECLGGLAQSIYAVSTFSEHGSSYPLAVDTIFREEMIIRVTIESE